MAPTCTHSGYGPALLAHPSHNCTHSSKLTFSLWKARRIPLASFCRTRTLNGIWTIYIRVHSRGSNARSDCSRTCTDFFTGLKLPIVMRLGEPVSELRLCAEPLDQRDPVGWRLLTVHTYGDTKEGTREPSSGQAAWTHPKTSLLAKGNMIPKWNLVWSQFESYSHQESPR
jgi:hypothetical protein